MLERVYQAGLIRDLRSDPYCYEVDKNDTDRMQGIPDLTVLCGPYWAMLEVKASAIAPKRPNQQWYIDMLSEVTFAAFIFPENEREVLDALQLAFQSGRAAQLSERELLQLASVRRGEVGAFLVQLASSKTRR